jgi:hypothetical protein
MREEDIRRLSEAIRNRGERPAAEQRAEMVRRGATDEKGKVILGQPSRRPGDAAVKPRPR